MSSCTALSTARAALPTDACLELEFLASSAGRISCPSILGSSLSAALSTGSSWTSTSSTAASAVSAKECLLLLALAG